MEQSTDLTDEEKQQAVLLRQNEQCEEWGYYSITKGYRKIPGNICKGGVDLSPSYYRCSTGGWLWSMLTFRNLILAGAIGAVVYFGWPLIEAVLIALPIPDPKEASEKMTELGKRAMTMVKGKDN